MSHMTVREHAFELEADALSISAEFDVLEETLQGIVFAWKRESKVDEVNFILSRLEAQEKTDRDTHRTPKAGEAYWVQAFPEDDKYYFLLMKLPSDEVQGWKRARFAEKAHPEYVHVPHITFLEVIQKLQDEFLGGELDSALKGDVQELVYSRLRSVYSNQISKMAAESEASQPKNLLSQDVTHKPVDPIDEILQEFGPVAKSSPNEKDAEPRA